MKGAFLFFCICFTFCIALCVLFWKDSSTRDFCRLLKGDPNIAIVSVKDGYTGQIILGEEEGLIFFSSMIRASKPGIITRGKILNVVHLELSSGAKVKVGITVSPKEDIITLGFPFCEAPDYYTLRPIGPIPQSFKEAMMRCRGR